MSITREELLKHRYKPFQQKNIKEFTTSFYQKRFDDDAGKKYFITIAEYDNRQYQHRFENLQDFSYSPEAQFTTLEGVTFDVGMFSPKSVEEMEEFFERLFLCMRCEYYEKYYYEEPQ